MSDTESSSSSAEEEKERVAGGKERVAEGKGRVAAWEQKTDGEAEEQQAPSAPKPFAWSPSSVYVRKWRRWGLETTETIAAGTRYRFSVPHSISGQPPFVTEVDVYAACQNILYVYVPATDAVETWTPRCNSTWTAVGVVDLDVHTLARMLRDAKKARGVPAKLVTLLKDVQVPNTLSVPRV